ncbi:unnamed protein product, partial [marine sediment metagenome]
ARKKPVKKRNNNNHKKLGENIAKKLVKALNPP